jgi:hypothetical protein
MAGRKPDVFSNRVHETKLDASDVSGQVAEELEHFIRAAGRLQQDMRQRT